METKLVFWILSVLSFWGYAAWYLSKWGVPVTWSNTYYRLNERYNSKTKGSLLVAALWGTTFAMLPVVMDKHPFMFLPLVLIALIGAAPKFRDETEGRMHMIGSIGAVGTALLAYAVVYDLLCLSVVAGGIVLALYTKKWKMKNHIMWIESGVIALGHLIFLFKDVL